MTEGLGGATPCKFADSMPIEPLGAGRRWFQAELSSRVRRFPHSGLVCQEDSAACRSRRGSGQTTRDGTWRPKQNRQRLANQKSRVGQVDDSLGFRVCVWLLIDQQGQRIEQM